MPVQNKACMEKYLKRCQERHIQKLRDMKCSIDNNSPKQATHLKNKVKKNALMEERILQVETENRLLLEKMSHIMRVSASVFSLTSLDILYTMVDFKFKITHNAPLKKG